MIQQLTARMEATHEDTARHAAQRRTGNRIVSLFEPLSLDREIARISAYSRHKPFYPAGRSRKGGMRK